MGVSTSPPQELVRFVEQIDRHRLKGIFLVHGDPARQLALFRALKAKGYENAHGPIRGETVDL